MPVEKTRVLLVEDNVGDARLVEELLHGLDPGRYIITHVDHASTAGDALAQKTFDVALIDLQLPDSAGLDTARRFCVPETPVPMIILTGTADEAMGPEAVRLGAQDYLVKDNLTGPQLKRAIDYSLVRHELTQNQIASLRNELQRLSDTLSSDASSTPPPAGQLRDSDPDTFNSLARQYTEALDRSLERTTFKDGPDTTDVLRGLAGELARRQAGSRDIVELHVSVLRDAIKNSIPERTQGYVAEGRLVAFELAGHLLDEYRAQALRKT